MTGAVKRVVDLAHAEPWVHCPALGRKRCPPGPGLEDSDSTFWSDFSQASPEELLSSSKEPVLWRPCHSSHSPVRRPCSAPCPVPALVGSVRAMVAGHAQPWWSGIGAHEEAEAAGQGPVAGEDPDCLSVAPR